ncbi:MAG: hypothetical protein P1U87_16065 [Verrucomicrobiales bacterium]|nr:hypothetical protein [Verrucomicrobiales bacterium]MDF2378541.1 hypothetical protein [Verrucomicrobiales bacterium]
MKKELRTLIDATSTPLSSIFGSGFLVIVPILAGAVGKYSVVAMAAVCAFAYAVGSVIRFNIRNAEPALADNPSEMTLSMERSSDFALVLAYVISVCLYLHILSSFVLGGFGADTPLNENLLTTAIVLGIMAIALMKGLDALGRLEEIGLYVTLLIIVLLLVGFSIFDLKAMQSADGIVMPEATTHTPWDVLTIVAGTLIVVQGFETSRYLEKDFDVEIRVRSSRLSQIISTVVYLLFIAVALPVVHTLNGQYDDNSLLRLVGTAVAVLVAPLIIAAALSQFSAAVADTLGATGNMEEATHGHLSARWGTLFVGIGAIALSWSANTEQILAIASRAFAFYYFLQCLVAFSVCPSAGKRVGILAVAAVLLFITVFAVPAG